MAMQKQGCGGNATSLRITFTQNHSNVSFSKTKKSTRVCVWWLPKVEYNSISKVKLSQSCPTLWDPMEYSPWNSPGQNTGEDCRSLLQGIFPIQESNPGLPHGRRILYQLSHQGSISLLQINNISSVQFSCSGVSDSLRPHESQHARPTCPSSTPEVYPNSCPPSR